MTQFLIFFFGFYRVKSTKIKPMTEIISYIPEYEYADADNHVGQQRADGHHVDELVQVEYARQYAWKIDTLTRSRWLQR